MGIGGIVQVDEVCPAVRGSDGLIFPDFLIAKVQQLMCDYRALNYVASSL